MKLASVLFAVMFSSCAFLVPTVSVHLARVTADYQLGATDTTKTILSINTSMPADFNMNGSNMISLKPGEAYYVVDGIQPGWYYFNIVGVETWVRNMPVYINGGDEIPFDIGPDHVDVDGKPFFNSYQEKSTLYSFYPMLSLNCFGCTVRPLVRFDGSEMAPTQAWITVSPGWHTIEIYSPLDHVQLYYRTLFDNYTITQFDLYPVLMY